MLKRFFMLGGLMACVTGISVAASAQETGSISAEAFLKITDPKAVDGLAIKSGAAMQFGTIYIPNGELPGSTCAYRLTLSSNLGETIRQYWEADRDGTASERNTPSTSGCAWEEVDAGSATGGEGSFSIACEPSRSVNIKLTYAAASGQVGTRLQAPAEGVFARVTSPDDGAVIHMSDDTNFNAQCFAGEEGGELIVTVGGEIHVTESAQPSSGAFGEEVGTITMEASY